MSGWDDVRRWRKAERERLIVRRQALPQSERRRLQRVILDLVEHHFPELRGMRVGFYWPFRGEIGVHGLVRRLLERSARAALPVVVEKRRPLEFWAWHSGDRLVRGVWDIPIPAAREIVQPDALLVPLVGFDAPGFRLGYGGGYYDRTLAAMDPKPLTIGLGYELGRLETIYPQPHDVPMDWVVSEAGVSRSTAQCASSPVWDADPNGTGSYASPPCFMHELDPSYVGLPSGAVPTSPTGASDRECAPRAGGAAAADGRKTTDPE